MSVFKKITKKFKGTALGAVAAPFTGGLSLAAGAAYDYMNYNKEMQKKQNAANQAAIDRANAYDMYTWDLANQYNNPSSQMARLKAAGLNPNLVYGSGSVTGNTAGAANSNGAASVGVYNAANDIVSKGLPIAQAVANLRNTNSQNELLDYQMGQTAAQTEFAQLRAKDLRNFLTGNGPSTYNRGGSGIPPSNPTDTDTFGEDLTNLAFGVLPYGSKAKKLFKFGQKYFPATKLPDEGTYSRMLPGILRYIFTR